MPARAWHDLCRSALRKEEKRRKKKEFKWAKLVVSLFRMLRDMPISFYVHADLLQDLTSIFQCACGPHAELTWYCYLVRRVMLESDLAESSQCYMRAYRCAL